MKNFAVLVLAIAAVFASSSAVEAGGGGGAKKNSKIKIVNNSGVAVGIILNSSATSWVSQAQVLSKGGVVVQPGQSRTFDVVAGSNKVAGFDPNASAPVEILSGNVNAVKSKTTTITLGPGTPPVIASVVTK